MNTTKSIASSLKTGRKVKRGKRFITIPDSKEVRERKKPTVELIKSVNCIITDECFTGSELVITLDGLKTICEIHRLIKSGKSLKALSFNTEKNCTEYKNITNVFRKKNDSDLLEVKFSKKKTICTEDHLFLTPDGWKPAISLSKHASTKFCVPYTFVFTASNGLYSATGTCFNAAA